MLTYKTIHGHSSGEYKEKGSKFIAIATQVNNEESAKEIILKLKNEHFKANHVCYAYKIGFSNPLIRTNDDGEPAHTAGIPILNQINKAELTNIVIAVVRYFGGVLLGKGGLIRAYGNAAENALKTALIVNIMEMVTIKASCTFEKYNGLLENIKKVGGEIIACNFSDMCYLEFCVPAEFKDQFI